MVDHKKVIICGYSKTGEEIAKIVKNKDYKFKIADIDEKAAKRAEAKGYEVYNLDLTEDENLIRMGVSDDISALFCVGNDESINLFITLSARNLDKNIKIITIASSKEEEKKMILAGADRIISPYEIGGRRIFRLLRKPTVLDILDNILFSKTDIKIAEITIPEDSILEGKYFDDLEAEEMYDLIIIGIQDIELGEKFIFYSSGINHKIDKGDVLVVVGKEESIDMFKKRLVEVS